MNRRIDRNSFGWKTIIAPLFVWGILVTASYSHGDKKHDDAKKKPVAEDITAETDIDNEALSLFSASLDSVYLAIGVSYSAVEPMLRNSCYDCHSAQTNFPWYHSIPGIKQLIDSDIEEAHEHLDMDKGFPFGGHAGQLEQLQAIREEVEEGEMPILSYRMMHWGKLIEGDKQDTLFDWIEQSERAIRETYSRYGMPLPEAEDHDADHDDDHDDDDGHDDDHDHDEDGQ